MSDLDPGSGAVSAGSTAQCRGRCRWASATRRSKE